MKTTRLTIAVLLWLSMSGEDAFAAACTSVATGNWNARTTWGTAAVGCVGDADGDGIPEAGDTAIIANTHTVTVNANTTVGAVTVNAGGTLIVPNRNFTVNGATNVTGTLSQTDTAGTMTFIGLVTINAGGVWDNAINEAITFQGGLTHNGATFTGGTATQTFDTNSQAIAGASPIGFGGVVAVGNGITVTNNNTNIVTIVGNLTGGAGSTWVNGANSTLNYGGALEPMRNRTFNASAAGNTVNYNSAGAQTVKLPTAGYYHLTLSGSGVKTMPGTAMTIGGNFTLSGTASATAAQALTVNGNVDIGAGTTFDASTFSHSVAGNFTNSGTFTAVTSTVTMNGAANRNIAGTSATTFNNLTVNNASGVTLSGATNTTVSTLLTLTSGVVTTGANTLITTANCNAPSVSRPVGGGHIAGFLQKRIPTGAPVSCTFEIGDATTYRPVAFTFASVTTAGNVTGSVTQSAGDHPDTTNNASGINDTRSVNRYWTFTNSGVAFTTFNATFNYVGGDVDGIATPANFVIARGDTCIGSGAGRTCATWATTTPSAPPTSTQASANGFAAFGDFAIGEWETPNFSREPQFIYTRELY